MRVSFLRTIEVTSAVDHVMQHDIVGSITFQSITLPMPKLFNKWFRGNCNYSCKRMIESIDCQYPESDNDTKSNNN